MRHRQRGNATPMEAFAHCTRSFRRNMYRSGMVLVAMPSFVTYAIKSTAWSMGYCTSRKTETG